VATILAMTITPDSDRHAVLPSGQVVVEARRRAVAGAWFLDGLLVWALLAPLLVGLLAGPGPGPAVVGVLMLWPVVSFAYGLTTARRRSLGQLAAGTRTVRKADGSVPGLWRAGWVMLVRLVIMPLGCAFFLFALLGLDVLDSPKERHLSIDVRATRALSAGASPLQQARG
jgi:hypothetical protein